MLSVLVKQGTTLHLSGEGGEGIGGILGGWGSHTFRGGRGELLLQSPEGGSCKLWANYPCDWLLIKNFFFVAEKQQRN